MFIDVTLYLKQIMSLFDTSFSHIGHLIKYYFIIVCYISLKRAWHAVYKDIIYICVTTFLADISQFIVW